ncbi:hypothetical protein PsYK624_155410 [Phanerochaete sordida]|uniref:BTB domain-containing protein n=1 Tax=Phanerochaete sordida TaxID=48140 RepID=A0A9P3GP22_9APHY|nr:hypothetical protein PsYK624_155410 [Phanerochaete sordida]
MTLADAPFNKPAADIIIRSSDSVDFYVFKSILAETSPFFEAMFTLPQATGQHVEDEYIDGRPVLRLAEPSKTLRSLLLFCYPVREPTVGTDADICAVLEAARKYDMEHVATKVRALFLAGVEGNPFRIYALAHARGWREEMRVAARATLTRPLLLELPAKCPAGLEDISTGDFFKLCNYQRACVGAAAQVAQTDQNNVRLSVNWLPARVAPTRDWVWLQCRHQAGHAQGNLPLPLLNIPQVFLPPQNPVQANAPIQANAPVQANVPAQANAAAPNAGLFGGAPQAAPNAGLFGGAPQAVANAGPFGAQQAAVNNVQFFGPPSGTTVVMLNGVQRRASRWWVDGVISIANALKKAPRGTTVLREDLVDAIVVEASKNCSLCYTHALADIRSFCDMYSLRVEQAVSEVELEF